MSRKKISPVPEFPGAIYLPDYLNLAQVAHFTDGLQEVDTSKGQASQFVTLFPALCACVEKWEIEGQPESPTVETFRAEPLAAANRLLSWVFTEVKNAVLGEQVIPNG